MPKFTILGKFVTVDVLKNDPYFNGVSVDCAYMRGPNMHMVETERLTDVDFNNNHEGDIPDYGYIAVRSGDTRTPLVIYSISHEKVKEPSAAVGAQVPKDASAETLSNLASILTRLGVPLLANPQLIQSSYGCHC